ncbi:MAG: hypothetical protein AAGJ97_13060 [Planctomycetota bacterium]
MTIGLRTYCIMLIVSALLAETMSGPFAFGTVGAQRRDLAAAADDRRFDADELCGPAYLIAGGVHETSVTASDEADSPDGVRGDRRPGDGEGRMTSSVVRLPWVLDTPTGRIAAVDLESDVIEFGRLPEAAASPPPGRPG